MVRSDTTARHRVMGSSGDIEWDLHDRRLIGLSHVVIIPVG